MTAGRHIISQNRDWGTPKKYVDAVLKMFDNHICLDPCSNKYSIIKSDVKYMLPKNGLLPTWNFPKIYVNPPYGIDKKHGTKINDWLANCAKAHERFKSQVLALVPVATNTGHWKRNVFGRACSICFLNDTRLKFLVKGKTGGKGAPMACAMIYWGTKPQKFAKIFSMYGEVVKLTQKPNFMKLDS